MELDILKCNWRLWVGISFYYFEDVRYLTEDKDLGLRCK